jgi:general secretion pathway protein K
MQVNALRMMFYAKLTPLFPFMPIMLMSTPVRSLPAAGLRHQRGVAIITALVVVAAATVAVSGMLWRQSIAMRKAENQAALAQSRWLARGAMDWARVILREDARISQVDHPGELWAVPLAETRVNANGIVQGDADDAGTAIVSGRIVDAQARYNLTNLLSTVTPVGAGTLTLAQGAVAGTAGSAASVAGARAATAAVAVVPPAELLMLARLLGLLGQAPDEANRNARLAGQRVNEMPRPVDLDDFAGVLGAPLLDLLRPYATVLPRPTPVNLNTAPAEVLAARFDNLPIERARALVESRERVYFNQISDAMNRLPGPALTAPPSSVATMTQFFQIEGLVRQQRVELSLRAAIERGANGATRIFDMREL